MFTIISKKEKLKEKMPKSFLILESYFLILVKVFFLYNTGAKVFQILI